MATSWQRHSRCARRSAPSAGARPTRSSAASRRCSPPSCGAAVLGPRQVAFAADSGDHRLGLGVCLLGRAGLRRRRPELRVDGRGVEARDDGASGDELALLHQHLPAPAPPCTSTSSTRPGSFVATSNCSASMRPLVRMMPSGSDGAAPKRRQEPRRRRGDLAWPGAERIGGTAAGGLGAGGGAARGALHRGADAPWRTPPFGAVSPGLERVASGHHLELPPRRGPPFGSCADGA
jgi:hypothetical protein